eukprot:Gb_05622 [translate_table: standard]
MLKTGGKIIPVFYHVKPCALRHNEKEVYAHAFAQHAEKGRYPSKKLSEWKEALNNVSFRSGFELNEFNDDQGRLLKGIISNILKESGNVKIVGIVGMDGSGKTTLAKELYYRKRSAFDRCSFLSGVRDASAKNELQRLQRQLLKDLACIDCEINSTSEGKGIIRARLNYTEILLVLDDIDHEDQLDAFIARDVLIRSDSSLIIVTTRDKDEEEKQIFLDIACFFIGQEKDKAVSTWDGSGWSGSHGLQTLEYKCLFELDDKNCLKMHDHLRDLGRTIADQAYVAHSNLDPCRLWRSEEGTKFLKGEMEIKHVRGVVGREHHGEPPKWYERIPLFESRLKKPTDSGVGLKLLDVQSDHHVKSKLSQDLLWLRGVIVHTEAFVCQKSFVACNLLRHLELHGRYNLRSLPKRFDDLTNLQHLDLRSCSALVISQPFNQLTQLQYLDLSSCRWIQPDILGIKVTTLEELSLPSCYTFRQESLMQITRQASLRKLILPGDFDVKQIPDEFWNLTNLQVLKIRSASLVSLPPSLGNLIRLTYLQLESCTKLKCLPESLGQLKQLTHLIISGLGKSLGIAYLPNRLGELTNLQYLAVVESPITHLRFKGLIKPTMLHLQHITLRQTKLQILSISGDDCPNLETLTLANNPCLEEVETLPASLVKLKLEGCIILKRIPGIFSLPKLQRFHIHDCASTSWYSQYKTSLTTAVMIERRLQKKWNKKGMDRHVKQMEKNGRLRSPYPWQRIATGRTSDPALSDAATYSPRATIRALAFRATTQIGPTFQLPAKQGGWTFLLQFSGFVLTSVPYFTDVRILPECRWILQKLWSGRCCKIILLLLHVTAL